MLEDVIGDPASPCVARVFVGDRRLWVYADTPDGLADSLSSEGAREAIRRLKNN